MFKITFRSRQENLDVYALSSTRAEEALRGHLGDTFGALESSVRAGAHVYEIERLDDGEGERFEIVSVREHRGETYEEPLDRRPLDGYASPVLTTADVAEALGLDLRRAQQLVAAHPKARKIGRDWTLPPDALADLRVRPARGWPRGKRRKVE